ncbi:MAG: hypothetical protein BWY70_01785 [Bacteroidetes bacterium ADurb.Bin408]|nr:MAG: hypothetical protein BWY70_01785 [Bacteroidetes bacterium ADurb.Bin408]
MGFGGKVCHIEQLSAAKEHGGEQSHGHVVGHQVYNCLFAERIAIGAAGKNQLGIGVEAAQFYLAFEGVNVGGEVECIGQYFCFTTGRFVKGTQEGMQVDGGGACEDKFAGCGPHERGSQFSHVFGKAEPGLLSFEPSFNTQGFPFVQYPQQGGFCIGRQQSQGIAIEVYCAGRDIKPLAKFF